ncbi:cation-transporting ATPase G [Nocardioides sp. YR527]|uniref:heavy metal translocating P-type ATPase n=1 Tax=Nocardioides sp. YR527 TaxID=1881028 RepID=UPI0008803CF1|nr:cation-translocating P-type ATPase [Nocardioides sp. YR527]SDJ96041.1 cation-transporting ATPase G [Nocardioides sp. YR527]
MSRHCCGPEEPLKHEELTPWWRDRGLLWPAVSGILLALGFLADWFGQDTVALVLEGGALAAGAWTFVPGALRRLRRGKLGVGLLMTIAAVGAVALGRIGEAAALAFLFAIAEALEDRAMDRAQHGLRALLTLIPDTARVERDGQVETVEAFEVRRDDVLLIGAGERVSTDGIVVEGSSSIDTSTVTGESIPVEVATGDPVPAGSVNGGGTLRIEATADGRDNSLTQIVRLVEEAHARKGDRARLADRIARPLVPAVLVLALGVALLGWLLTGDPLVWVERALVVLVAASPCAMAIAVPVTVISAIGSASKLGVIIKSGQAFEQLGTIRAVALDKTGTLTRNQPSVVAVTGASGWSEDDVLRLAAAVEATSTHPLAEAVRAGGPGVRPAADVQELAGHGLRGIAEGRSVRVGSPRWVSPGTILGEAADSMAERGMSVIVVEADDVPAGVIGVRDELKPEAAEAIAMLHQRGIRSLMLTGDNERTARALAAQVGIDDVRAEELPADKAEAIESSVATTPTAMIGDGINDAPALAAATVGIAMGVTGSAAAVESADVAFTGTDLRQIPLAFDHAKRGRAIMTGNIALALAIIVVLVPLALVGVLGLAEVVLVHELAEVVVILNGLRAARVRDLTPPRATSTGQPRSRASAATMAVRT